LEEKAEKAAEVVEKAGAAAHRMQSLVMVGRCRLTLSNAI
jgi:hypothetical protein